MGVSSAGAGGSQRGGAEARKSKEYGVVYEALYSWVINRDHIKAGTLGSIIQASSKDNWIIDSSWRVGLRYHMANDTVHIWKRASRV